MKRMLLICLAATLSACATVAPNVRANQIEPAGVMPLDVRIGELVAALKGEITAQDYFNASFLIAVPEPKLAAFRENIIAQYGLPIKILTVEKKSQTGATVTVAFQKAIGTFNVNIETDAPNKVNGLFATDFAIIDDSFEKIAAEFAALPGTAGFLIEALNDGVPNTIIAAHNADRQMAIGSTFKLYILAELASQIEAGERRWSDAVPLSQRSFSSPATEKWPMHTPVTLATLALQMISVSDNSATDTLLYVLGRTAVEKKLAQIGHNAPDKILPFLSTVEAFALKSPGNGALRHRYLAASEGQQREMLATETAKLGFAQIDDQAFAAGPAFNDTIEWFAAPSDISALLNNIRRSRNDRMLEIMAVSNPLPAGSAGKWGYVGYKGGSEPGVVSMSYLLRSNKGQWYAISGSWNDPDHLVDEYKFGTLMSRLVHVSE
jgi:beta-lactamase class A